MDKVRFHLDDPPAPQRDVKSVADVLKDVVDALEQPVQENVLMLREAWPSLMGGQIAAHSEPGFISNSALTVFVDHPGWIPELERVKRPLLMKLQSNYRSLRVKRVHFALRH